MTSQPNPDYIQHLRAAILQIHNCDSAYSKTVHVDESYRGQTLFKGDIEVFAVNHPKSKVCYAWTFKDASGEDQVVAVLKGPGASTPVDAVKAFIALRARSTRPPS